MIAVLVILILSAVIAYLAVSGGNHEEKTLVAPDPPTELMRDSSLTSKTQVSFTW